MVVLGATEEDTPLVTDFARLSRKFLIDGLNPYCITSFDIHDAWSSLGDDLTFGRDDFGRTRSQVLSAGTPCPYTIAPPDFKAAVLSWIQQAVGGANTGDKVTLVSVAMAPRTQETHS